MFRLRDGETIICAYRDAVRTLDKRSSSAPAETVWEITTDTGLIRRVWPNELIDWTVEERE